MCNCHINSNGNKNHHILPHTIDQTCPHHHHVHTITMTPKSPTSNASFVHNVNVLVNGIISCNKELKALLVQLDSDSISWEEKQIIKLQIEDKNDALRKPLEGMPLHVLNDMHRKLCILGSSSSTRKCSGPKKKVPQAVKKRIKQSRVAQQAGSSISTQWAFLKWNNKRGRNNKR